MINVKLVPIIPQMQNYAFILEAENGDVAVVDPGDAGPIIAALEARGLKPDMILITHHHWDHVNGLPEMLRWHSCPVYGPAKEADKIRGLDVLLDGFSEFSFGGEDVRVIDTPGHTMGHIVYYFQSSGILMAGDTLFSMGCGRLMEGSPADMWRSLEKLSALPDETHVYCGHEYTLNNGEFALTIEPENSDLAARMDEVRRLRENDCPTLPVSLKTEKDTNVFLRAKSQTRFAELRALKDNF
jgi:hydroxyacylglutathione hydrolase